MVPFRAACHGFLLFLPHFWMSWLSLFLPFHHQPHTVLSCLMSHLEHFPLPILLPHRSSCHFLPKNVNVCPLTQGQLLLPRAVLPPDPQQCSSGTTEHPSLERLALSRTISSVCRQARRLQKRTFPAHHHPSVHQSSSLWEARPLPLRHLTQLLWSSLHLHPNTSFILQRVHPAP